MDAAAAEGLAWLEGVACCLSSWVVPRLVSVSIRSCFFIELGSNSVPPMSLDVSFSISPDGLEEVISAMTATVAVEPYDTFATTWAKVGMCLLHARLVATRHDRRVLARLEHLTVLGVWHGVGCSAASKATRLLPDPGT